MQTQTQSTVSEWIEALGVEAGTPLSLDQDGHCLIRFGDQLECMVEVPQDSEIVFVYAALKRVPDDLSARSNLLERALELNMFSLATGGASVTYDRRTQEVVLTFAAEVATMDSALFQVALGDFLELASDLHEKLGEEPDFPTQSDPMTQQHAFISRA